MKYIEWRDELEHFLGGLDESERENIILYYGEMYADKRDSGLSEEDAVAQFGAPYDAAKKILDGEGYPKEGAKRPAPEESDQRALFTSCGAADAIEINGALSRIHVKFSRDRQVRIDYPVNSLLDYRISQHGGKITIKHRNIKFKNVDLKAGLIAEMTIELPADMTAEARQAMDSLNLADFEKWWTPEWYEAIRKGLFIKRDLEGGQMSRDMTVFVDDDGKAYHIYSSEDNLTLHIAELSDDYLTHTGKYVRLAPAGHNEAPAIFKKDGTYWMITSGCTGWDPNEARMFSASSIWGPWTQHPNPCVGPKSEITFGGQSTYILKVPGKDNAFIFMADVWRPEKPSDARYIWLPIQFKEDGTPYVEWMDQWTLDFFNGK